MQLTIFGTGYVGLVLAAVLADAGNKVTCVDVDAAKIENLKLGIVPIYEPGLEALIIRNRDAGRLTFSTDPREAVEFGEIIFIAVGTPTDEDGSADLKYVLAVASTIGRVMENDRIVVTKSTVPVGTADQVEAAIKRELASRGRDDLSLDVVSNPEFLKEGAAVADCQKPDRIVLGIRAGGSATERTLRELYAPFNRNHEKIIVMDVRSAELTKYAANCLLATKISFMNEIANLADRLGADVESVRLGIGSDPRIGNQFIYPGAGYGGSCFPKDVRALISMGRGVNFEPLITEAVERRNQLQKQVIFEKIVSRLGADLRGRTFALWGLAFKPNTDDMREAPSRVVIDSLLAAGATVRAYDPKAMEECGRIYRGREGLVFCASQEQALTGADALVVMTEWKEFQSPDLKLLGDSLRERLVFDGRNIYDPSSLARHGLTLCGIGRAVS
ncbi:UDP-glucose/GDP-mannose dehydrogenase family protein [Pseudohoeflea suaedae]|uniref:UDP-glucose 6-dehydrogenase n=1 Tax=Pseudohoeflea suaedae TaxID=877384 RepID=A0A4R5PPY5_9HYPH|nr:UDP-glucose/GDP-mannose dehydrogenase family protein [Pseudohoeflea suaedae]TDH38933.1 UDP-glucose/GDP-mannose dehydrogenase family protein [Pseudohoeflea suaedae]